MFTGVIHHIGTIMSAEKKGDLVLTIRHSMKQDDVRIGDSIACNGCCLTVIDKKADIFSASLSEETLRCTASRWKKGDRVHLERALRMGDTLDGHMVSGHVDGLATILSIIPEAGSYRLEFEVSQALAAFIAAKGSVTLDGISLTVNSVNNNHFSVNIIPHTWEVTTFRERQIGDTLNLEIDLIARYVARLMEK